MSLRDIYRPEIAKIIADNPNATEKELRKLLRDANTGTYNHHIKMWRDECKKQLQKKFIKDKQILPDGLFKQ